MDSLKLLKCSKPSLTSVELAVLNNRLNKTDDPLLIDRVADIQDLTITVLDSAKDIDLTRFACLTILTVKGLVTPKIKFGGTRQQLTQFTLSCPILTTATILLSELGFEALSAFQSGQETNQAVIDKYKFKQLKRLFMSGCNLSAMDNSFHLLPQVEYIDLSKNWIGKIQFLQQCPLLDYLDVSFNPISSLLNLTKFLGSVTILKLRGCQIQNVTELTNLKNIQQLDLSDNLIQDEHNLQQLTKLPLLTSLYISGNPICVNQTQSRQRILEIFYNQEGDKFEIGMEIDGKAVQQSEVQQWLKNAGGMINYLNKQQQQQLRRYFGVSVRKTLDSGVSNLLHETQQDLKFVNFPPPGVDKKNQTREKTQQEQYQQFVWKAKQQSQLDMQEKFKKRLSDKEQYELLQKYYALHQVDMLDVNGNITNRPDSLHPFGKSVPHSTDFQLKRPQMPYFTKRFQEIPEGIKKRTEYQMLSQEISSKLTNNFANMKTYRQHLVVPIQSRKRINFSEEQKVMKEQDNYSKIQSQCAAMNDQFTKRLREAGHPDIYSLGGFVPIFLRGKKDGKQALDDLCLYIGIQNFISVDVYVELENSLQSIILSKIVKVINVISVDMQVYLLYHFFCQVLKKMNLQNSEDLVIKEFQKQLLLMQEYKAVSEVNLKQRQQIFQDLKYEQDSMMQCIQHLLLNKIFERKVEGQEAQLSNIENQKVLEENNDVQLIAVKVISETIKICKYYDQNQGKIIYIQKEGQTETILQNYDDSQFDIQVQEIVIKSESPAEVYQPDPDEYVRTLQLVVPHGNENHYVDKREVDINLCTGRITEYSDQRRKIEFDGHLSNLVTFIVPKISIVEDIYKCVVLLFYEPEKENGAQGVPMDMVPGEAVEINVAQDAVETMDLQQIQEENQNGFYEPQNPFDQSNQAQMLNMTNPFEQVTSPPFFESKFENNDEDNAAQDNQKFIPKQNTFNRLPFVSNTIAENKDLQVALPGVTEDALKELLEQTANLNTENSLDPLRVAHSFTIEEQLKLRPGMRNIRIYYLASEQQQKKNMSQLSSYTELIELLALQLMRAYKPDVEQETFWGYCLRCSRSFRASFLPGQQIQQLKQEGNVYNVEGRSTTFDSFAQQKYYRKVQTYEDQAIVQVVEDIDYYQVNESYVQYNDRRTNMAKIAPPFVCCPHCDKRAIQPCNLNLDIRRKIRAIENMQTGEEFETKIQIQKESRHVQVEVKNIIWDTVSYDKFMVEPYLLREVDGLSKKRLINERVPDDVFYWVIRRPADFPTNVNVSKYIDLVTDPLQLMILTESFNYCNIPEPARRYLMMIGDNKQIGLLNENILPRMEQSVPNQSEVQPSSSQSAEEVDEELQQQEQQLQEEFQQGEQYIMHQLQSILLSSLPQTEPKQVNKYLYPFDISQYCLTNPIYYSQLNKEYIFRGFLTYTSQEFNSLDQEKQMKIMRTLLSVDELDLMQFMGIWFIRQQDKQFLIALFKNAVAVITQKNGRSISDSDVLHLSNDHFLFYIRQIQQLELVEYFSLGGEAMLDFGQLAEKTNLPGAIQSFNYRYAEQPDPAAGVPLKFVMDEEPLIEFIQQLKFLRSQQVVNAQFCDLSAELNNKVNQLLIQQQKIQPNSKIHIIKSFNLVDTALIVTRDYILLVNGQLVHPLKLTVSPGNIHQTANLQQISISFADDCAVELKFSGTVNQALKVSCISWRQRANIIDQLQALLSYETVDLVLE